MAFVSKCLVLIRFRSSIANFLFKKTLFHSTVGFSLIVTLLNRFQILKKALKKTAVK